MATVIYPNPAIPAQTLPMPLAIQAESGDTPIEYGGQDLRWVIGACYNRPGRIGFPDSLWLYPRLAGANFSVDVQAGQAIIAGTGGYAYAPERYLVSVPTRTNLDVSTFNPSPATTKTHAVWIGVRDREQGVAGVGYGAQLVVTEDVGAGAPDPTTMTFYAKLGTFTISPSQSNITAAHLSTVLYRASRAIPITTISYASGFNTYSSGNYGQPLSYSIDGNTVRLQGTVYRTAGDMVNGTVYTIATLPSSLWPKFNRMTLGCGAGPNVARVQITTTGDLQVTLLLSNVGPTAFMSFDGITYEIS